MAAMRKLSSDLLTDLVFAIDGTLVALLLLRYLHYEWQPGWALGCGVVAGIFLRRGVAPIYSSFPDFLRRPLNIAVVLLGTVVAVWATLAAPQYGVTYLLARWREAAALTIVGVVLGLAIAAAVYTHARMRREVEAHRLREAALRETALRARLRALQAQINPHFLFNAFNALAELAHDDPDLAEEMIGDLAHLLRYSLRSSALGTVPLSQELDAVDRYLRVERARLGDRLRVERHVDPSVVDTLVPGLILQPLVENAVQYAVASRPEGGSVQICVESNGDRVRIVVEDDGPGIPDWVRKQVHRFAGRSGLESSEVGLWGTGGAGGGIANVQQRLTLSYRGTAQLAIAEPGESGSRVEILVPR